VPGAGIVALKTREAAAAVLAAKVLGTRVLEQALADEPLDFFLACSSLASIAGGVGQIDYCGANAFLDAWSQARALTGAHTSAIDWDAWQQVGMAVNTAAARPSDGARLDALRLGLTPDEGVDVFRRVVESRYPQIAVCTVGLDARLRPAAAPEALERARPLHPRPPLATEYVAPASDLEQHIAATWQQVLGVTQVGTHDNFFELGGDSLTALRAIDLLRDGDGPEITITMFYAAPTIRLLVAAVAGQSSDAHGASRPTAQMLGT
jgi:acyl carrier protein